MTQSNVAEGTQGATLMKRETVRYQTVKIQNLDIFYREAGDKSKPTILLLHGFPSSSHMFRNLIPLLATQYHVVAPDYPGFGQSSAPSVKEFEYSFDHLAEIVDLFTEALKLDKYSIYIMDYGAPVGFRLALKHPERIQAIISQNGNAYEEGLSPFWDHLRSYWKEPENPKYRDFIKGLLTLEGTKSQYLDGAGDPSLIDPDSWTVDQFGLDRPGQEDIQLQLFYSYQTNVAGYPKWHEYLKQYQPPTLITWGKNDAIFPAPGAEAFKKDLKDVEIHLLNSGHFALEEYNDTIASLILDFLNRHNIK